MSMPQRATRTGSPRSRRLVLTALAAIFLLAAPAQAASNAGPATFDAVILRPLNFLQMVTGAVLFLPVSFLTSIVPICTGNSDEGKTNFDEAFDVFVYEPAERTFLLPLGSF